MLRDRAAAVPVIVAAIALAVNWTSYVWCVTHGRVIETALGYFLSPIGLVVAGVVDVPRAAAHARSVVALGLAAGRGGGARGRVRRAARVRVADGDHVDRVRHVEEVGAAPGAREPRRGDARAAAGRGADARRRCRRFGPGSLHGASTLQLVLVPLTGVVTTVPLLLFAYAARRVSLGTLGWLQY